MIRWKFTFDKDAEEAWINDYCQHGWAMASFFAGAVTFVPCQPGEYIYQIDLLPGSGLAADDYEGYVVFMTEIGVEVVERWGRWVYLRKRAEDGPFEIYTDLESQIQLYQRMRRMFIWALCIELLCSCSTWSGLFTEDLFLRGLVGVYIILVALILRAIWNCTRRIHDLERQRQ